MSKDFYEAATFGEMDKLKRMLNDDPSLVHWHDEYGFTALHGAAGEENVGIIEFLVESGADVNAQNEDGITPLHICCSPKVAEVLIACGANIELQSNEGDTPLLILSTEAESEDVMEVLLRAGANVNATGKNGLTALSLAISRGENVKVNLLKKFGAM